MQQGLMSGLMGLNPEDQAPDDAAVFSTPVAPDVARYVPMDTMDAARNQQAADEWAATARQQLADQWNAVHQASLEQDAQNEIVKHDDYTDTLPTNEGRAADFYGDKAIMTQAPTNTGVLGETQLSAVP